MTAQPGPTGVGDLRRGWSFCSGCGRTFAGVAYFDAHQIGLTVWPGFECRDPATLKRPLVQDEHGVWGTPAGIGARAAAGARMAALRARQEARASA